MDHSQAGKKGYEKTKTQLNDYLEKRSQRVFEEYESNPKLCPYCGTKISFDRRFAKFCNRSCAASYNNQGVSRNSDNTVKRICKGCGNTLQDRNEYCPECIEKRIFNRINSFEDAKTDRTRKQYLLDVRGHQCESCRLETWLERPIPLELDHKDGNSDNNSEDNLRLLCPNCHALTETYKGANAGKNSSRQKMRRKRYADGLTY